MRRIESCCESMPLIASPGLPAGNVDTSDHWEANEEFGEMTVRCRPVCAERTIVREYLLSCRSEIHAFQQQSKMSG